MKVHLKKPQAAQEVLQLAVATIIDLINKPKMLM